MPAGTNEKNIPTLKCLIARGVRICGGLETSEVINKQEVGVSGGGGGKNALKSKIMLLLSSLFP